MKKEKILTLYVDGSCKPKNPGGITTAAWAFFNQKKELVAKNSQVVKTGGPESTNNTGEYYALYLALEYLQSQKWYGDLTVCSDSNLLVRQVLGEWKCNAEHLKTLRSKILTIIKDMNFHLVTQNDPLPEEGKSYISIMWVPREKNNYTDNLCEQAYKEYMKNVPVQS